MNVSFKTICRLGDKAYVLSEISDCDEYLPVVLSASTESGALIPSDTFPYCDIDDAFALRQVLFDGALANQEPSLFSLHSKNSAGVRFFVIALPWLEVKRWDLVFKAIDSSGNVITSCRKNLDVRSAALKALASHRTNPELGEKIKDLDGRFVHDRIRVSFLRAVEAEDKLRVSALIEMPYHDDASVECDFLDSHGRPLDVDYAVVEDSIAQPAEYGALRRRYMVVSFLVDENNPRLCFCVTDTLGMVAPGFAMLGARTTESLIERFQVRTTAAFDDPEYHRWFSEVHRADVPVLLEQVATRFEYAPLFSIVCLLVDAPDHHIYDFVNSVVQQSYGHWELILVDMVGTQQRVDDLKDLVDDDRLYVIDADPTVGIDANFGIGLEAAEGDFVVFSRVSDVLAPDALFECARTINEYDDCDFLYTDVDTCDAQGNHSQPLFRPDFSPELLRSFNYIRDLVVVRESLLANIPPLSCSMFEGGGYELVLRATEKARRVCHVPRVLCYRRLATLDLTEAKFLSHISQEIGRKALVGHCQRMGIKAEVLNDATPGHYRIRHVLTSHPRVTIVVSYEDNPAILRTCIRSLYEKVTYDNFEVVVVDTTQDSDEKQACFADLQSTYEAFSILSWNGPTNRAKMANYAVEHTQGEFLMFIGGDARVLSNDALETLLGYFQSEEVAVVGPKQLFVDDTIEHAGIVVGGSRAVVPLFRYLPADWRGYLDRACVAQNVSAVTGECMMIRRSAYDEVGGFSEELALFYADVDFCLKIRKAGYLTVFTPYVELSHLKSTSRLRIHSKELRIERRREMAFLQAAWPSAFVEGDAFYNPNLDPDSSYFALKHMER